MKQVMFDAGWTLAVALLALPAHADCKKSTVEFPVRLVEGRPIAMVTLNGVDIPMLVDSGAFFNMLPASTARQLKLPAYDLPTSYRVSGFAGELNDLRLARVKQMQLGGKAWSNVEFIVGGNEHNHVQGILGRSVLAMGDTEYNLARGVVRLVFPSADCGKANLADWAGGAPVFTAELVGEDPRAPLVSVLVNGKEVSALMDTGSPVSTLQLRAARRAGVKEAELAAVGRIGGAGAGRVQTWTAPIASFEFGAEKLTGNRLAVSDFNGEEMLLGLDYFLSHHIYVSRLQRKVYATYNGGPVFSREWDATAQASPEGLTSDDADALARWGMAAAARNDLKSALAYLDRACALAPQEAAHRLERARVYMRLRRWDEAIADLDEVLKRAPDLHEARIERASLRGYRGDVPQALADLQAMDAALPPSAHLRERMARLYRTYGPAAEALRQWQLWLDTHPDDARADDVLNARCWLRVTRNFELPLALEDCKKAIAMDRRNENYQDSLGWAYLRLGDAASALKAFDVSLKLKGDEFSSFYGRALSQQRLGQAEAAARDLAEARRLKPDADALVRKLGLPTAEPAAPAAAASAGG